MRISDWSSDVCSSDLGTIKNTIKADGMLMVPAGSAWIPFSDSHRKNGGKPAACWTFPDVAGKVTGAQKRTRTSTTLRSPAPEAGASTNRSEEHTSELQSLMRISYAVFCLKKKNT